MGLDLDDCLARYEPIPRTPEQVRLTERLCREAGILALRRHAGRLRHLFSPQGRQTLAEGKDLTAVRTLMRPVPDAAAPPGVPAARAGPAATRPVRCSSPTGRWTCTDDHYTMAALESSPSAIPGPRSLISRVWAGNPPKEAEMSHPRLTTDLRQASAYNLDTLLDICRKRHRDGRRHQSGVRRSAHRGPPRGKSGRDPGRRASATCNPWDQQTRMLVRLSMPDEVEDVVACAEISLQSGSCAACLAGAAERQGVRHRWC